MDPLQQYIKKNRTTIAQNIFKQSASHKSYNRFPKIGLPEAGKLNTPLSKAICKRKSIREYSPKTLTIKEVSTVLYWSIGVLKKENQLEECEPVSERPVPSGGAKYPLEAYVLVVNVEGVAPGLYHYNTEMHALEQLPIADSKLLTETFIEQKDPVSAAGMVVLLSFDKGRNMEKYGALAYKLSYLEGGHVGQNIYLTAAALSLGCCGLGMPDPSLFDRAANLDGIQESFFYSFSIGSKIE